jgi:hypothetical protein
MTMWYSWGSSWKTFSTKHWLGCLKLRWMTLQLGARLPKNRLGPKHRRHKRILLCPHHPDFRNRRPGHPCVLGTKGIPNGRRRDPAGRPGFRLTYENSIFGAPDRWPLVTRLTAFIPCALPPPWCQCNVPEGVGPSLSFCINQSSQSQ